MVEDFFYCKVTVIRKGEKWSGVIPAGKLEAGVPAEKISLAENVEWIFYLLTTTRLWGLRRFRIGNPQKQIFLLARLN